MGRKVVLLLYFTLCFLIVGCPKPSSVDPTISRVPVSVELVGRGEIAAYVSQTGTLLSAEEMTIATEAGGEIHFNLPNAQAIKKGDFVKEGQLIALLTNAEYELSVALDAKKLALDHAIRDYEQTKKLLDIGGSTLRDVESAERTKVNAENAYKTSILNIEKLKVEAPLTGIITDLNTFVEGQKVNSGAQIGKIMRYDKVRCELSLTGDDYIKVHIGQEALVSDISQEKSVFHGVVSKINPTIDPTTRTVKAEVEIENSDLHLKPGAYVKVDIVVEKRTNIIKIPRRVIVTRNNRDVVFIVTEDQKAKEQPVIIGLKDADFAEIIDGLKENDRLVIRGFETLQTNTNVRISQ